MRYALVVLLGVLCSVSSAAAQVSIGIGLPSVSIGINLPLFPELVVVPNYPVYYARTRPDRPRSSTEAASGRSRSAATPACPWPVRPPQGLSADRTRV
jgi:hypothetical protein